MGPVIGEGIPREVRDHQWSALNVPLLWAAAEDDRLCPMILWLREVSQSPQDARCRSPDGEAYSSQNGSMTERILNVAVAHDARVSALESVFVSLTLGECEQREPDATVPRPVTSAAVSRTLVGKHLTE